ncbi:hypothetical protein TWF569_008004 [Orbilia oligospora]|uniref:Uncharacterized protein n=1 Tax=Orbilia oligospora TaxID=2813651 RepID=A0A7C8N8R3_ORBOL|nr:hypothetical protein TWF102_000297 [Orbilia oligospora]KAF3116005.1 hypothetical protein TWF103_010231 [Orbilia oligospora]KAF3149699.1 hypothetical protein TWF594_010799 [Orbilia oligospora]KAF3155963.1 hypothetical protein TWF569_008004 [Orbilia oligospora]
MGSYGSCVCGEGEKKRSHEPINRQGFVREKEKNLLIAKNADSGAAAWKTLIFFFFLCKDFLGGRGCEWIEQQPLAPIFLFINLLDCDIEQTDVEAGLFHFLDKSTSCEQVLFF